MQHGIWAVAIALAALVFAADIWADDENRVTISKKVGGRRTCAEFPSTGRFALESRPRQP